MKFSTIDGLPFEDPAWIAGVDGDESDDDDDDTYSDESESEDESDVESDSESETDEILEIDDEIEAGNFEPEPEIIDEVPNPTVVIDEVNDDDEPPPLAPRIFAIDETTDDDEPPLLGTRRSTHETHEPEQFGFANL